MLPAVALALDALTVLYGYTRIKTAFKRGLDMDRALVVHCLLKTVTDDSE